MSAPAAAAAAVAASAASAANGTTLTKPSRRTLADFSKLGLSFLRRYVAHFHLEDVDPGQAKEVLVKAVAEHFEQMEINPDEIIKKFLEIKKAQEENIPEGPPLLHPMSALNGNLRQGRTTRQEARKQQQAQQEAQQLYDASPLLPGEGALSGSLMDSMGDGMGSRKVTASDMGNGASRKGFGKKPNAGNGNGKGVKKPIKKKK
ncbi:unnamed protein product [Vitrella brassicaformis CCMP3155]|uniref:Histone deacetylase complex subunit SAP30 Sin3 binding domain-containing protein n=1 Tax=Vitrella brassicaformis (strain CCMP3155) TaxID=1169540 RepID=A0A0G4EEP1_VITBC|nr:unnamed protein product [Vitrella brassicaformis CCMP3155]|mmetsp:Transcript_5569/g.13250  ORF Transcript_5569/g.13250 Transcript_5569/m.13250 type:complete len:204 (-) Transcript_5569:278-889(-)|eukprot:CEL94012.1 unnamed protein product [Vitrella brassicaformis CCMP3155]